MELAATPSRTSPTEARRRPRASAVAVAVALCGSALTALTVSAPATAGPGDVVVSEDFSAGALPAGWRAIDGTWKVQNGRLYGTSTSSSQNNKITFGRHLTDFRFEATVRFESVLSATRWTALGLDIPADGGTPWWIATMRSGSTASNGLEFAERTTANTWNVTNTGSAPYAAGTGRDIRIAAEVHGNQARWFFDGREYLRTSSLQRSTTGGQALFVNGSTVSFDNIKITELEPNGLLRPAGSPLTVIAHRGASSLAPENTLVAQEIGRRAGAEWIENDVRFSLDGVPFLMHDATVDRTTDGTGPITSLTAEQIKALDAGSWFAPQFAGATVPTLAEQLADLRTRGGNLLLEVKPGHSRDDVAKVVAVVREEQMTNRVLLQSFDVDVLRYSYELAPELPIALLRNDPDADPVAVAKDLHLTAYVPAGVSLFTRPAVVKDLHTAGVAVMVWTLDSANQWKLAEEAGVDGVITNRPAELAGWNAAYLQRQATVAITSPADGARLDRAQAPVLAVAAANAASVTVTLDGAAVEAGRPLDLTTLAPGAHTLVAEATGPFGSASATVSFTVQVTVAGLGYVVFNSGAEPGALSTMATLLAGGRYTELAEYADKQAGNLVPARAASLIAADARALAAG